MAHLPPPPPHSLFLLFLAVHGFVASHGLPLPPSSTYNDSMCSESFWCGGVDIKYPFYLSNAIQETPNYTSHYSCGYTDMKIFCQGEGAAAIATLPLDQYNYTVHSIIYDNRTIVLGDKEVLKSGKCPTVSHNVTFSYEWLNYTDSSTNLTFFLDCYSRPGDQQPPNSQAEDFQVDCKGINSPARRGDGVSFVFTSEQGNVSGEYELVEHCSEIVVVPVHEEVLMSEPPLLPNDYGVVLKHGFQLEWKQSTELACNLCEESKGRCAYSENRQFIGCLCSGGKVGAPDCNGSGAAAAYPNTSSGKFFRTAPSILVPSENKRPTCELISPEDKPSSVA